MEDSPSPSQRDRWHDLKFLGVFSVLGTGVLMYLIAAGVLIAAVLFWILIASNQISLPTLSPIHVGPPWSGGIG